MKKGFTLVEMLAVIVIIGLTIVLVASKVKPSIDDSKRSVGKANSNLLISALEDYYFQAKLSGGFIGCSYNFDTNENTCSGFSFNGEKPSSGIISLSADGVINGNLFFQNNSFEIVNNVLAEDINIFDD